VPDIELRIEVESNTEALTAMAVHRLIKDLVDASTEKGEVLLLINTPKDTGMMAEHVGRHPTEDFMVFIRGSFGIPPIELAAGRNIFSANEEDSALYPLFVDQGTGIHGTRGGMIHPGGVMVWEDRWPESEDAPKGKKEGKVFRYQTEGQEGQHFMLETFQEMVRLVIPSEIETFERRLKLLSE
jgi:hypothetical protein